MHLNFDLELNLDNEIFIVPKLCKHESGLHLCLNLDFPDFDLGHISLIMKLALLNNHIFNSISVLTRIFMTMIVDLILTLSFNSIFDLINIWTLDLILTLKIDVVLEILI